MEKNGLWIESIAQGQKANKKCVEKKLREASNSNALLLHMWEEDFNFLPSQLLDVLKHVPPSEIPAQLAKDKMGLISTTLLPAAKLHQSIVPYGIKPDDLGLGYAFDLHQHGAHPMKIALASAQGLNSSGDYYKKMRIAWKNMRSKNAFNIPMLAEAGENYISWLQKIAEDKEGVLTQLQLSALAQAWGKETSTKNNIKPMNEVLLAASVEHIAAIVVPYYPKNSFEEKKDDPCLPLIKLIGALAGLEHINANISLPVVMYNVVPGQDAHTKQGDYTYVGEGKRELIAVALDAINELNNQGVSNIRKLLRKRAAERQGDGQYEDQADTIPSAAKRLLHIDISKPLSEQKEAVMGLQKENIGSAVSL